MVIGDNNMKNTKSLKLSLIINIINFVFITFATISMYTGFNFMTDVNDLSLEGYSAFQFFTVDSNLLLGFVIIIFVIYEILLLSSKINEIPKWVYIIKHVGTVGVTLTMLVTVFFLGFIASSGYFSLFTNANLFYHLLSPLLSLVCFILLENTNKIKFNDCLFGMLPLILYSCYYISNVLTHMENGKVSTFYDFYYFAQGGIISIIISTIVVFSITFGICYLIYYFNRKLYKE